MRYTLLLVLFAFISCKKETKIEITPPDVVTVPVPDIDVTSSQCTWSQEKEDRISYKKITENSGMAYLNNALYITNDSGDSSRFFACKAPYSSCDEIKTSIKNNDFEGMAIYKNDVVVCDCGNSWGKSSLNLDYCDATTNLCKSRVAKFPGNGTEDIETFMISPINGDVFFVSKNYDGRDPKIWKLEVGKDTVQLIGSYKFDLVPGHKMKVFSAGDMLANQFIMTEIDGKGTTVMVECKFDLSSVKGNLDEMVKNNCKTFKVKSLGQIESLTMKNDREFMYSSEGSSAPLVTMVCE